MFTRFLCLAASAALLAAALPAAAWIWPEHRDIAA